MRQHAVTSSVMTTARDPWVNMLRTTVACFAAGVGGADAITVQPFDAALGLPDAFARRIARNTQALLTEESHLGRVLDPAGGSWYVESLTDALAHAAWDWFTELERAGGYAAALSSGLVRDRVAAAWADRSRRLATRRDPITGVSEFPNLAEKLPERRPAGEALPPGPGGLPRVRAAQAFEQLRDRADASLAILRRTRRPAGGVPGDAGEAGRAHRAAVVRDQPVPGRRPRDAVRCRGRGPRRGHGGLHLRRRPRPRRRGRGPGRRAPGGRRAADLAGRQARPGRSTASTATCSPAATPSTS